MTEKKRKRMNFRQADASFFLFCVFCRTIYGIMFSYADRKNENLSGFHRIQEERTWEK